MGQQQLLLLVLGIVIVGLAVVVGIQAFSENQKKANADALVNDAIRISSDAQAWKLKPGAFGGGASATNWTGVSLLQLGYTVGNNSSTPGTAEADQYENLNGIFDLSASGVTLTVDANSYQTDGVTVLNHIVVAVTGTEPSDITTQINPAS
ncbi:MAG: hypothetical protein ACI80V_001707 [Rhodothermales bacterium]|jgi:hypothetical protein